MSSSFNETAHWFTLHYVNAKLSKFMCYMATSDYWCFACCLCAFAVLFRNLSQVWLRTLQSTARKICSDVKSSRPKWPRGLNFGLGLGLGLEALASASASNICLDLASISLSYYVIGIFSGKNRVQFGNFANFPAIILNRVLLIVIWYFFIIIFSLGLSLDLIVLASSSASRFWPRLTSL